MKSFKDPKYSLLVLRRNTDPVVTYGNDPVFTSACGGDMDPRVLVLLPILDRVSDKVLEELLKLKPSHFQERQQIVGHLRSGFVDSGGKIFKRLRECVRGIAQRARLAAGGCALRVSKEILHHAFHSPRAVGHEAQILLPFRIEAVPVAATE